MRFLGRAGGNNFLVGCGFAKVYPATCQWRRGGRETIFSDSFLIHKYSCLVADDLTFNHVDDTFADIGCQVGNSLKMA